ncbi:MAG TPA: ABC transporter permease [Candidatus Saccharimonadales bacterium]|nr:ABC transporter permease [Candidatus Saccharimonadales bacterium]
MNRKRTLATTARVLRQLKHDPRTLALVLFVPCVLIVILKYVYNDEPAQFDRIAPMILGVFPLIAMFLVTSIAMLRERTGGTMERIMTLPMTKLELMLGYGLAFVSLAILQCCIDVGVTLGFLGVHVLGGTGAVFTSAVLAGLLGMTIGLFLSAFATTEYQAVQFMPTFIMPQLLIGGFFVPREHMAVVLQWISDVCPLTYVVEAMRQATTHVSWSGTFVRDLVIVALFCIAALTFGAVTLRRQEN